MGRTLSSASYSGDSNFAESAVANPLSQNVGSLATATSLMSSLNPSIYGQLVTFTREVEPTGGTGTPTGQLTFVIDGSPQSPESLQLVGGVDEAVFATSTLSPGSHTVSASYSGDATFGASTLTAPLSQVVNPLATVTTVVSSPNPAVAGEAVSFVATVTGGTGVIPNGTVTFIVDGTHEAPVAIRVVGGKSQAVFSTSTLTPGPHSVTATYSGNAMYSSSSAAAVLTETAAPSSGAGPSVMHVQRYGYHRHPTSIVLFFNEPLDPSRAEDVRNYRIDGPKGQSIGINTAHYNAATQTVTLKPNQRIDIHHNYHLTVNGKGSNGVASNHGTPLDSTGSGDLGSDYTTTLNWRNLVFATSGKNWQLPAIYGPVQTQVTPKGPLVHQFIQSTQSSRRGG